MLDLEITDAHVEQFREDGFIVFEKFLDMSEVEAARERYEVLFRAEWETGIPPDEINWTEGRDDPALTRQLCNSWKSDYTIASIALRSEIGRINSRLAGWPGARIHVSNEIWKPPGASALVMHQDGSWLDYLVPPNMTSLWMALDDTSAEAGTVEYVKGSNHWTHAPKPTGSFLADDYRKFMREAAAAEGLTEDQLEIVPIEVPAGGIAVHDCWTWHGSAANNAATNPRRALVSHCTNSQTRFHPTHSTHYYVRYRKRDTDELDESFFPILWREDGYRTPWLDDYMANAGRRSAA